MHDTLDRSEWHTLVNTFGSKRGRELYQHQTTDSPGGSWSKELDDFEVVVKHSTFINAMDIINCRTYMHLSHSFHVLSLFWKGVNTNHILQSIKSCADSILVSLNKWKMRHSTPLQHTE